MLKKALDKKLPIILIINKIDRSDARIDEVLNEVYDLFIDLDATDEQIEFPVLYSNAKLGVVHEQLDDDSDSLKPLFETILNNFRGPVADDSKLCQFLITNLDYDPYVGQIAVGRLNNGKLTMNSSYSLCAKNSISHNHKFSALYTFNGLKKIKVNELEAGDIIADAGIDNINIGDSISDNENPKPLPRIEIDAPTVNVIL